MIKTVKFIELKNDIIYLLVHKTNDFIELSRHDKSLLTHLTLIKLKQ